MSLEALSDLCTPWSIRVAATLRIAHHIVAGTTDIHALAAAASCDVDVLHGVLSYLVGKGIFEEPTPGRFALNAAASELLDPAQHLSLDLNGIGGRFAYAWGTLPTYVRTGQPGYRALFGRPFWEDLDAHPSIGAGFDAFMAAVHGSPDPDVLIRGDWEMVGSMVDVGGGTGTLLAAILRARPAIQGTLVDLPRTVARSGETFQAAGVADRVTVIGQSFFDPLPAGADLYLLMRVLNDWPDRAATTILRRCAEAARPDSRIVVSGGVAPDDTPRSIELDQVLLGSQHRPLDRFRALAKAAGLQVHAAGQTPSGRFAVECRPLSVTSD